MFEQRGEAWADDDSRSDNHTASPSTGHRLSNSDPGSAVERIQDG
jgi:hypothetical protein